MATFSGKRSDNTAVIGGRLPFMLLISAFFNINCLDTDFYLQAFLSAFYYSFFFFFCGLFSNRLSQRGQKKTISYKSPTWTKQPQIKFPVAFNLT